MLLILIFLFIVRFTFFCCFFLLCKRGISEGCLIKLYGVRENSARMNIKGNFVLKRVERERESIKESFPFLNSKIREKSILVTLKGFPLKLFFF